MQLIDVHCHLDDFFFNNEIDKIIENCRKNNCLVFTAGITPDTNRHALELSKKYPDVVKACLGIYPPDALRKEVENEKNKPILDYDIDEEIKFIENNKDNIIAVGEVGMDFKDGTDFEMQERIFRKMIELAMRIDKPLVIHSRKAEMKVIDILEEYKYRKVVMHCFGGKHTQVKRIRENKWYFSIPTSIVRDQHFQKIVKETGTQYLLTETDSPFLSPFKDSRNEPSNVIETIKVMAKLRNMSEDDIANLLHRNCRYLFGIK